MTDARSEVAATLAAIRALKATLVAINTSSVAVSPQTEQLLRLGRIFLSGHGVENFSQVHGFQRVRRLGPKGRRHPDYQPPCKERNKITRLWVSWSAFKSRPPINVSSAVYDRFTHYFSSHWPDLEWPRDIPRPTPPETTSKENAA